MNKTELLRKLAESSPEKLAALEKAFGKSLSVEKSKGLEPSTEKKPRRGKKCKYHYTSVRVRHMISCVLCGNVSEKHYRAEILSKSSINGETDYIVRNEIVLACSGCRDELDSLSRDEIINRALSLATYVDHKTRISSEEGQADV